MEVAISVIVPVYNVEKTLSRCIDSVLNQTFKNYEIILVDDGSPDNSGLICDEYAKKFDFIRVIHKQNEGLGPTRNAGVLAAKGDYIYHCDSDDWIKENTLEDAYNCAIKNNSEVVVFGYTMYTNSDGNIKKYAEALVDECILNTNSDVLDFFINNINNYFVVQSACNKLIKRSFLIDNDIWFKPFRRSQDVAFSFDLFDKITHLSTLNKAYYEYIIEPNTYKGRTFEEMLDIYLSVYQLIEEHFISWKRYTKDVKNTVVTMYCSHIANYISFYISKKENVNKNAAFKMLFKDERIKTLFNELRKTNITSKFLKSFSLAIEKNSIVLLYCVLFIHQKTIKNK